MKQSALFLLLFVFFSCKKSVQETAPKSPTGLVAKNISKNQIDLTWTDNSNNENGFYIERKSETEPYIQIGNTAANTNSFSDLSVRINTNYTYRVSSYNQIGTSVQYSNEASITSISLPTINTIGITDIQLFGTKSGGNITSDGGSAITARGIVWGESGSPTISLSTKTSDGTGAGSFQSVMNGLVVNTTYYVRAYATNAAGTTYGNQLTFRTLSVGDAYQGGIIVYFFTPTEPGFSASVPHGIIMSSTDLGESEWIIGGSSQTSSIDNTSMLRSTGQANTNYMLSFPGVTGGAAKICDDYSITVNGVTYSDWYLPSAAELFESRLSQNRFIYWSSSQSQFIASNAIGTFRQADGNVGSRAYAKTDRHVVRAFRTF